MAAAYGTSNTTETTGTSIVITKPASTAEGDLMLAQIAVNAAGRAITAPAGWTSMYNYDDNSHEAAFYYKYAGGSEPANYTWSVDGGSVDLIGAIERFTDIGPGGNTITYAGATASGTAATLSAAASITPQTTTSSVMVFASIHAIPGAGADNASGYAIATDDPGDWTERIDLPTTPNAYLEGIHVATSTTRTETTATGNWSVNIGDNGTTKYLHVVGIQLAEDLTVSVSPSTQTATFGIQSPIVDLLAEVSAGVQTATWSIPTPTVTTPNPNWTYATKSQTEPVYKAKS